MLFRCILSVYQQTQQRAVPIDMRQLAFPNHLALYRYVDVRLQHLRYGSYSELPRNVNIHFVIITQLPLWLCQRLHSLRDPSESPFCSDDDLRCFLETL